jgi:hypothetical protein
MQVAGRALALLGRGFAVALAFLAAPVAGRADTAGQAVAVVQRSEIATGDARWVLQAGETVRVGDIVRTDRGGEAQLVFTDETRIVVGPNSSLRIDEALFRNNNTARRLTVSALGGTFRFISGNSASRAYAVRTPTATMGIRGTAFDFTVTGTASTDLVVYDGQVRFCGDQRQCAVVPGGCNTATLLPRNAFDVPETPADKTARLSGSFPYLQSQAGLLPPFQLAADGCSDDNEVVFEVSPAPVEPDDSDDGGESGRANPAE